MPYLPSKRTIISLIGGGLLGGAVMALPIIRDATKPSLIVENLHEDDGIAVRGGSLELAATVRRERQCRVNTDRWLWRYGGDGRQHWYWLDAPHAVPIKAGDAVRYVVHIALPRDIPPGSYFYRSEARDECRSPFDFLTGQPRTTPDVPISVVNPTPENPSTVYVPDSTAVVVKPEPPEKKP